jgi:hypothetical protein
LAGSVAQNASTQVIQACSSVEQGCPVVQTSALAMQERNELYWAVQPLVVLVVWSWAHVPAHCEASPSGEPSLSQSALVSLSHAAWQLGLLQAALPKRMDAEANMVPRAMAKRSMEASCWLAATLSAKATQVMRAMRR